MYRKTMLTAALCLLASGAVMAQDSDKGPFRSYNYVEVQGGGQITLTDAKKSELLTPFTALSIGRYFTPVVGARLHVSGWENKSGFDGIGYYKWNYITTNADLTLNLTNLICNKKEHFLNVIFIGGVGLTNSWGNDEAVAMARANHGLNMPFVYDENRLSHNIRAGLRLETNPAKPLGVSLEVCANSLDDRFNSKYNNADDWMVTGMIGVSFRFGHKRCKPAPAPVVAPPAPEPKPESTPTPAPEPKPEPKVVPVVEKPKAEKLREEAFFEICESDPKAAKAQLQNVAAFMKRNPEAKVFITGYADKGTGNPTVNMKYSKQRAEKFKDELVKNYGVSADRITIEAKGDKVQPFSENDKNRCVIVLGE